MGGGGKQPAPPPPPPPPPPPGTTAREALQAELEFRPAFREEDVRDILRFGEAAAQAQRQFGFPLLREERELLEELEPETFAVSRELGRHVLERLTTPLTPADEERFRERFRAEEAAGGRLGSPVGSATIARQLAELEEARRLAAADIALSFLGRVPTGPPSVPVTRGTEFGQFVSPFLSQQASIFGTQAGFASDIFRSQASAAAQLGAARTAARAQIISAAIPRTNLNVAF
jgi:hypothetical protein